MKILVVDDHQMVGEGLTALLEQMDEVTAVRRAADGFEAVNVAKTFDPDVVVMDITMPGMNGIEATRQIVAQSQGRAAVLVLSMHADPEFVAESMRSGAKGYIVKSAAGDELRGAVRKVASGQTFLSPSVAGDVVEKYVTGEDQASPPKYALLSPRERQTLQMLADGMSVKEIAFKLNLSDKTVHAFRANLMEKLDIDSIAELTKYAVRHGLTPLD